MREPELQSVILVPKAIDNSQVVRERDPRSSRDLFSLLLLVAFLVGGLVLYAWPHFELRQAGIAADQMRRERDRLIEENRKLRLEKASLENLRRVEAIAVKELGLAPPPLDHLIVVEKPAALPDSARLASSREAVPPSKDRPAEAARDERD